MQIILTVLPAFVYHGNENVPEDALPLTETLFRSQSLGDIQDLEQFLRHVVLGPLGDGTHRIVGIAEMIYSNLCCTPATEGWSRQDC